MKTAAAKYVSVLKPGRRPRSAFPVDTRAQILASARSVFARTGFDGASVREVAQAANVNTAMIYYHFTDKIELYRAVLTDSFAAFDRIWEHAIFSSHASAREKIRKFVEELIRFQQANYEMRKIISMELTTGGANIEWLAKNLFPYGYRKLEQIIRQAVKSGELKKVDPSIAISCLTGMILHCFIMRPVGEMVSGKQFDLSAGPFGDFVCTMFFDGLGRPGASTARSVRVRTATR